MPHRTTIAMMTLARLRRLATRRQLTGPSVTPIIGLSAKGIGRQRLALKMTARGLAVAGTLMGVTTIYWVACLALISGTLLGAVLRLPAFLLLTGIAGCLFAAGLLTFRMSFYLLPIAIVALQIGYGVGVMARSGLRETLNRRRRAVASSARPPTAPRES